MADVYVTGRGTPTGEDGSRPLDRGTPFVREGCVPVDTVGAPVRVLTPRFLLEGVPDVNAVDVCMTMEGPTLPSSTPVLVPDYYELLTGGDTVPRRIPTVRDSFFYFLLSNLFAIDSFLSDVFVANEERDTPVEGQVPLGRGTPATSPPFSYTAGTVPRAVSTGGGVGAYLIFRTMFVVVIPPYCWVCLELLFTVVSSGLDGPSCLAGSRVLCRHLPWVTCLGVLLRFIYVWGCAGANNGRPL